jgi:hypothetical protein
MGSPPPIGGVKKWIFKITPLQPSVGKPDRMDMLA